MRDLDSLKFENDKAFAQAHGWRVEKTPVSFDVIGPNEETLETFFLENKAWRFAAAEAERNLVRLTTKAKPPLKTYSVIGRYFDNGQIFNDAVAADNAKDAVAKVAQARNDAGDNDWSERDWEVIAVLTGSGIEDVTPLEYIG